MNYLGHSTFFIAGHDRGGRVAHRLAIDHPARTLRLAVLDIIPTLEHFERTNMSFALGYYHWFWLAQPHPFPEILINASPEAWFIAHTSREPKAPGFFAPQALADYMEAVRNPEMIRGMCEDYRAAATIDLEHDRASRATGRKIESPLLVLWGAKGKIGEWYDPLSIWKEYCSAEVTGGDLNCGHYVAEEAYEAVAEQFAKFFS
jgi:haloacetate dehalogenase